MKRSLSASETFYLHQGNQNQSLSKYQKQKCKKKCTLNVTHFKRISSRFCVCVVYVCVEGGGGWKSIQYIITLDMKQWIYDKIFKIFDKYKINLPSELKEIMKNQKQPKYKTHSQFNIKSKSFC